MIHDPVMIVVPCAIFEVEFPIPPEKVKPALLVMLRNEVGRGECQTRFAKLLASFRDNLEENGDFGVFWSLLRRITAQTRHLPTVRLSPSFDTRYRFELSFQCHRFEVNLHPVAGVMLALLKSGQSASREEAVEEMKDCRSMEQHWCRSTVMPEYGLSIFYDRLKPRSNHKLLEYPLTT
ncbi:hypothetical protein F2Q69_00022415 [Brassica cretica]|uniref:Uncharacterized protein n=1 Tax=Brassica cretica TaxID=69181 RepID=A0A8S9QPD6_BRACR|nr:hypothetical protein F2Q69_00022415 [Brassica cretica]